MTSSFSFGDVVVVKFAFTDQSDAKQRPAIVVSSSAYNRSRLDVTVVSLTSQASGERFGEVAIEQWQAAGLLKPTVIKPVYLTVEKTLVLGKIGKLQIEDRRRLAEVLPSCFGE